MLKNELILELGELLLFVWDFQQGLSCSKVVTQEIIFTILIPAQISFAEVFNIL